MKRLIPIAALALMLAACSKPADPPEQTPSAPGTTSAEAAIVAVRTESAAPGLGADASAFDQAAPVSIALLPQQVVAPFAHTASVSEISVRAVHDGKWLAIKLTWADVAANTSAGISDFEDMVALQFPRTAGQTPNIMMGAPGSEVVIVQWRAARQAAIDRGERPEMRHTYPNANKDIDIADLVGEEAGGPYTGGAYVDNPLSLPSLDTTPVLTHVAAGFGTLTALNNPLVAGRGIHANGQWVVVLHIPLGDEAAVVNGLAPGVSSLIAFAAWDGGNAEVGSRKSWSPVWTTIELK